MLSDPSKPSTSSFEGDFAPGQVLIGRYRIIALVGEGGMGQVHLADDLVLGQPVAVKFLPRHFLSAVTMIFGQMTLTNAPLTLRPEDWYFSTSVVVLGMLAAVGGWAYRAAVART